jgi:hypothetical protein
MHKLELQKEMSGSELVSIIETASLERDFSFRRLGQVIPRDFQQPDTYSSPDASDYSATKMYPQSREPTHSLPHLPDVAWTADEVMESLGDRRHRDPAPRISVVFRNIGPDSTYKSIGYDLQFFPGDTSSWASDYEPDKEFESLREPSKRDSDELLQAIRDLSGNDS